MNLADSSTSAWSVLHYQFCSTAICVLLHKKTYFIMPDQSSIRPQLRLQSPGNFNFQFECLDPPRIDSSWLWGPMLKRSEMMSIPPQ